MTLTKFGKITKKSRKKLEITLNFTLSPPDVLKNVSYQRHRSKTVVLMTLTWSRTKMTEKPRKKLEMTLNSALGPPDVPSAWVLAPPQQDRGIDDARLVQKKNDPKIESEPTKHTQHRPRPSRRPFSLGISATAARPWHW